MGRLMIEGLEGMSEITRNDSTSVLLRWAVIRVNDTNLMFTFDESDRDGLNSLEGSLLSEVCRSMGLDEVSAESVTDMLLPKKIRKSLTKKAKAVVKSALEE